MPGDAPACAAHSLDRPLQVAGGTTRAAHEAVGHRRNPGPVVVDFDARRFGNGRAHRVLTTPDPTLPNIAVVILDSTRRDHLGYHGYARPTSRALDTWSGRARVYDTAFSASSWTVPTVAALLSVPPSSGRAQANLVDMLVEGGYATACFTDNPHLTPGSLLTAHFNVIQRSVARWRDPFRGTLLAEIVDRVDGGSDRLLVDKALGWLEHEKGPTFLYVHLMDSHTPYRFPPIDGKRRPGKRIEFPVPGMSMTSDERESVIARYDGGVRSASDNAARLLAGLARHRRPFLAIVTSDHGESLGEEGVAGFTGRACSPSCSPCPSLRSERAYRPDAFRIRSATPRSPERCCRRRESLARAARVPISGRAKAMRSSR
jgi:glucan phosphoethanolaminetransferase (alkaline phosphatase superfamily)